MLTLLLIVVLAVIFLIYIFGQYNESYWTKRGVKFHKKNRLMGPLWDFLTQDRPMFQIINELYKKYRDEPAIGMGGFLTPSLYVIDPVNASQVLQQDFQSFSHRGLEVNKCDFLANNILFMNGKPWRLMRHNMTPLFTSAKLKKMYYIMDKASVDFVKFLRDNPDKCRGKMYETINQFCNAAVNAAVFGIGTESTFDSPFLDIARKAQESTIYTDLKFAISSSMPSLFIALKLNFFKPFEPFFIGAIKQVLQARREQKEKKHDFADICLSIQEKGLMKDPDTGFEMEPTDELLAAQGFFFFVAGVEPCASVIFAVLLELGRHPEIQERVLNEIDAAYEQNNAKITYDVVSEMEYLDKVFSEAMRLHPPIGFLTRKCVKDTVLPVGNIPVAAGTKVFTPIFEYHHDPKYYPNPEVFDPERFSQPIDDNVFMPFGRGGRSCIGMRYARLQVKAGLVHMLRNFSVTTSGYVKYAKAAVQVRLQNVDLEFTPRNV